MKKIKSKLALLFSVALLGTMFIVPSASAETTEQWATLYEQNFKEEGLTKDEVIADGLYLNAEKWWINTKDGLRTSSTDQYVYYTQDLGNKYKISGTFNYGSNSWPIIYGGTINEAGTQISGKQLFIDKNGAKAKLDGEALQNCYDAYATHKFELLYDNGTVTVTMKDSNGTVKETKSKTYDSVFSSNYFGWKTAGGWLGHMAMYDLKIEVPAITAEFPVSSPFAVERPIEISFNKSVDGETVADALSISPEAGDATVTMSDDGMTAYVKYSNLTPLETYTLSLGTFSNENGVYADEDTYEFSVYELANAVSDNFKAVTTIKNGETFTSWIKLSSLAQNITSVKLCTNENTEGVSATYDSVTGRYVAETSMTETGEIWFEVTDDDDITISVTSDYPVYVQEFSAAPIGFIDSSGNAVTSLSTGAPLTAEFDTDLDDTDSITVMCFYDSEGKMIKLVSANGNTAEIDAVPANAVSVKAMMFKSFASPSMVCGGLELN